MLRIAVFCEARADFTTATELAERVLAEEGPEWVRDLVEHRPWDEVRVWVGAAPERFFNVHYLDKEVRDRRILLPRNRFDGAGGGAGALAAHTAYLVARNEAQRSGSIDAILFVWDADDQGDARWKGPDQARQTLPIPMILGCPDLEREAWVLAGFMPKNRDEQEVFEEERRALGFDPVRRARDLRHKKDHEPRSPKRVVKRLTGGNVERESLCWTETPLATLHAHGEHSGLRAYLDEVREHLLPLFSRG